MGKSERTVEEQGWRAGRPVEDPDKTKEWGRVTAKPSEFLVHVRRGQVLPGTSGQGASCWKWPRDSVAIVPTSLQQLAFRADQVTAEKVGVEVVGLAVYRIAEPLIAYRVLNFSYPERAQEKLAEALTSMLVGATRRLVANLSIEDCLKKRKAAIAEELLREVAPVVGGQGRPEDSTDRGWGVVIDTIEIQEVRVASEKLFAAMQAPFRAAVELQAKQAQAETEEKIAVRQAHARRAAEEARLQSEEAIRLRRLEHERAKAEAATADLVRGHERSTVEAQAELAASEQQGALIEQRAGLALRRTRLEAEVRAIDSEANLLVERRLAEAGMAQAQVENLRAEGQARLQLAEQLPNLAAALGSRISEVRINQYGGTDNPFGSILQALESVIDITRRK